MTRAGEGDPRGRTPYDDEYATCERAVVTLCIYGDDLDPIEISSELGLEPTSSQARGQTYTNSIGRQRTATIGGWFLTSEGHVNSKDLRRHLDWLLELIRPKARTLRSIQSMEGMWMNVSCIWWSRFGDGGPTLWPAQMQGLADLDLECGFDISFHGEDDG